MAREKVAERDEADEGSASVTSASIRHIGVYTARCTASAAGGGYRKSLKGHGHVYGHIGAALSGRRARRVASLLLACAIAVSGLVVLPVAGRALATGAPPSPPNYTTAAATPLVLPGGGSVYGVTTAAFNGHPDIVAEVCPSSGGCSYEVMLNGGYGNFSAPVALPGNITDAVAQPAVGDFNGDGKIDVVGISASKGVVFWAGNGDGSFQNPVISAADPFSGSAQGILDAAKLSGTGNLSIIAYQIGSPSFGILAGQGSGTFSSAASYTVASGSQIQSLAVADLNGSSSYPDVAAVDTGKDAVQVLMNTGTGSATSGTGWFGATTSYSLSGLCASPSAVEAGNFIRSTGYNDLAVSCDDGYVYLLTNNGAGTFTVPSALSSPNAPGPADTPYLPGAGAVDLNGDGTPDLLFVSGDNSYNKGGFLTTGIDDGAGNFTFTDWVANATPPGSSTGSASSWQENQYISSAAVGDFNGDGTEDIAVAFDDLSASDADDVGITILYGNPNKPGRYQAPESLQLPHGNAGGNPVVTDWNGDGKPDILSIAPSGSTLEMFAGNGDGTFNAPTTVASLATCYAGIQDNLTVGDFNGDGHPDAACTGEASVSGGTAGTIDVVINDGTGGVSNTATFTTSANWYYESLATGRFDQSNGEEIAALRESTGTCSSSCKVYGAIDILKYTGTSTLTLESTLDLGSTAGLNQPGGQVCGDYGMAVADMNGDGNTDLATWTGGCSGASQNLLFFKGDGSNFTSKVSASGCSYDTSGAANVVCATSTENPGIPASAVISDLFASQLSGSGSYDLVGISTTGTVYSMLGNGDGTFQNAKAFSVPYGGGTAEGLVADLNEDNYPDVAYVSNNCGGSGSSGLYVLAGNGDGTFGPAQQYPISSPCALSVAAGDLAKNGYQDLVVFHQGTVGTASLFSVLMQTAPSSAPSVTGVSPSGGPTTGGTSVTITGTNFTGATGVAFGSTPAASFSVVSSTEITATTSPASAGTVDVRVATSAGTSPVASADEFQYTTPPSVTGVSPVKGTTSGGTTITITGTDLLSPTAVTFGSTPAASFMAVSSTEVDAVSPLTPGASTVDVRVTTEDGGESPVNSPSDQFTFVPPPAVTSISLSSGPTLGGTLVEMTGTAFTGATAVDFGTTPARDFAVVSDTLIEAVSPEGELGTSVNATVTTPYGISAASSGDKFSYVAPSTTPPPTSWNLSNPAAADAPGPTPTYMTAVSCVSASFCMAVGHAPYGVGGVDQTFAAEWNGTAWTGVATPNNPATGAAPNDLYAVSCTSTSWCVAVGQASVGNGGDEQTLVEAWNGSAWSIATSPNVQVGGAGTNNALNGVSCTSTTDCTAAGEYWDSTNSHFQTLVETYSSGSWSIAASLDQLSGSSETDNDLNAVSCVVSGPCTAVGYYQDSNGHDQTLVETYSSGSWSIVSSPDQTNSGSETNNQLYGISCPSSTSCVAVGGYYDASSYWQTLAETWNGSSWSLDSSADASTGTNLLYAVSCTASNSCFAAGEGQNGQFGEYQTLVEALTQATGPFGIESSPDYDGTADPNQLNGVSCTSSTTCIATGYYQDTNSVDWGIGLTYGGSSWNPAWPVPGTASETANDLQAVSCGSGSPTFCAAVGDYGGPAQTLAETLNGSTWSITPSQDQLTTTANELDGVSCTSSSFCMAVGYYQDSNGHDQTLVETWNGSTWSIAASPDQTNSGSETDNQLSGVSCTSATSCVAVGYYVNGQNQTLAALWNGSTWTIETTPDPSGSSAANTLQAVSCSASSPSFCVAVGEDAYSSYDNPNAYGTLAVVSTDGGSTWNQASLPVNSTTQNGQLNGIACTSTTSCQAVGYYTGASANQTLVMSWDGISWSILPSPDTSSSEANELGSITCTSQYACVAVGHASTATADVNLVEFWGGTAWGIAPSQDTSSGQANDLAAIACATATSCVAAGEAASGVGATEQALALTGGPGTHVAVTAASPSSGSTAGGATVVVNGNNLTGAAAVDFGTTPAASFTVDSSTQVTATSPPEAAGIVDVTVTTPSGGTSFTSPADTFTYTSAPSVTGVSPSYGSTAGGASVTISGYDFTGAAAVDFGTTPAASFTVDSSTQVTATSPPEAADTVDVTVTTPSGGTSATSSADRFTFQTGAPPTVTGVSPVSGSTSGSTSVTITGTNFLGATAVDFGSVAAASFTVYSGTQVTAISPSEAAGTVDMTVTTPAGTSATSTSDEFTFTAPPPPPPPPPPGPVLPDLAVTSVSAPTSATAGATGTVSFTVENQSKGTASAPWVDTVFLGTSPTWSPLDEVVGSAYHATNLAPYASYTESISAPFLPLISGAHYVFVRTNSTEELVESNYSNDLATAPQPLDLIIPLMAVPSLEQPVISSGGYLYRQIDVGAETDIELDANTNTGGEASIYASFGSIPTPSSYGQSATPATVGTTSQQVLLPGQPQAGVWYVLVTGNASAGNGSWVTLEASEVGIIIYQVSPNAAPSCWPVPLPGTVIGINPIPGCTAQATLTITGAGFTPGTEVYLQPSSGSGYPLTPTAVTVASRNVIYATLNITDAIPGAYDVYAVTPGGTTFLSQAFTVGYYKAGSLILQVSAPSFVRAGVPVQGVVTFSNMSGSDMPTPLIVLSATQQGALIQDPLSGQYTTDPVYFVAQIPGGPPGILPANSTGSESFMFIPDSTVAHFGFDLRASAYDSSLLSEGIDWSQMEAPLRPPQISASTWDEYVWPYFTSKVGTTFGDLLKAEGAARTQALAEQVDLPDESSVINYLIAEAEADAPGAPVSGTVRNGPLPTPGANVVLTNTTGGGTFSATTFYDGSFSVWDVPAGTYSLSVTGEEPSPWGTVDVPAAGSNPPVAVDVSPGQTVEGTVVDSQGDAPVSGATVTLSETGVNAETVSTDGFGHYQATGFIPGTVTVTASALRLASASTTATVTSGGGAVEADVTLSVGGSVAGQVVSASGSPVQGAIITAIPLDSSDTGSSGQTDGAGRFTIANLASGSYDVTALVSGRGSATDSAVVVRAGRITKGLVLTLSATGSVTGTVSDASTGRALAGATVTAVSPGADVASVLTAADGTYAITGIPSGQVAISVTDAGYLPSSVTVTVASGKSATGDVAMTAGGGGITVTVTDSHGTPLAGTAVDLVPAGTQPSSTPSATIPSGTTASNGAVSFTQLAYGSYTVVAAGAVSQAVTLSQTTPSVQVNLQIGIATILGTVTAPGNVPASGWTVEAISAAIAAVASTTTSAGGSYSLSLLQSGQYDIVALPPGLETGVNFEAAMAIPATIGEETPANIAPGTGGMNVDVVQAGGESITGAVVRIELEGLPTTLELYGATDSAGQASFSGLPSGEYYVGASAPQWGGATAATTTVSAGSTAAVAVMMTEPAWSIAGKVEWSDGTPASDISVGAIAVQGSNTATAVTASDGTYTLSGLVPDTYDLWFVETNTTPTIVAGVVVAPGGVVTFPAGESADVVMPGTAPVPSTSVSTGSADVIRQRDVGSRMPTADGGYSGSGVTMVLKFNQATNFTASLAQVSVSVANAAGQVVWSSGPTAWGGVSEMTVDSGPFGLPPGQYTVTASNGYGTYEATVNLTATNSVVNITLPEQAPGMGWSIPGLIATSGQLLRLFLGNDPPTPTRDPADMGFFSFANGLKSDSTMFDNASAACQQRYAPGFPTDFSNLWSLLDSYGQAWLSWKVDYGNYTSNRKIARVTLEKDFTEVLNDVAQVVGSFSDGALSAEVGTALAKAATTAEGLAAATESTGIIVTDLAELWTDWNQSASDIKAVVTDFNEAIDGGESWSRLAGAVLNTAQDAVNMVGGIQAALQQLSSNPAVEEVASETNVNVLGVLGAVANALSLWNDIDSTIRTIESSVSLTSLYKQIETDQTTYLSKFLQFYSAYEAFENEYQNWIDNGPWSGCKANPPPQKPDCPPGYEAVAEYGSYRVPQYTPPYFRVVSVLLAWVCEPDTPPIKKPKVIVIHHEETGQPHDPNGIQGPAGYGAPQWISGTGALSYQVQFQNASTASAWAAEVRITTPVDPNLDWSTFQLGTINFGDEVLSVPPGLQAWSTELDLTKTLGVLVKVSASFDPSTGAASWDLKAIDPATGMSPVNPDVGLLPPDNGSGSGDGYAEFTVLPKAGLATGTTVSEQASIVFDQNAPMSTPAWVNTVDDTVPTATITTLPATSPADDIAVSWAGNDGQGPGVATYAVDMSVNGGAYESLLTGTATTSLAVNGIAGDTYGFAVVATDQAGNSGAMPFIPQATTLAVEPPPVMNAVSPVRVCDTRSVAGIGGHRDVPSGVSGSCANSGSSLAPHSTTVFQVTGFGGVPLTGVAAVDLNVTDVDPGASGYLTLYQPGTARPGTSNLNFSRGRTAANLAEVTVSASGQVAVYNGSSGYVDFAADVDAYDASPTGLGQGLYVPVQPERIADTRCGVVIAPSFCGAEGLPLDNGALGTLYPDVAETVTVAGIGGIPLTGVAAVVLNVTALAPSAGYVTVYPGGSTPTTSNLNVAQAGVPVANEVIVPVGVGGTVSIISNVAADVVMDIEGYITEAGGMGGEPGHAAESERICDTRTPASIGGRDVASGVAGQCAGSGHPLGPGGSLTLQVAGMGGVPLTGVAAVTLDVAVTDTTGPSYLAVYPGGAGNGAGGTSGTGSAVPMVSDLNWTPGETVANLVTVQLSPAGTVTLCNFAGSTDVVADVLAWYSSPGA